MIRRFALVLAVLASQAAVVAPPTSASNLTCKPTSSDLPLPGDATDLQAVFERATSALGGGSRTADEIVALLEARREALLKLMVTDPLAAAAAMRAGTVPARIAASSCLETEGTVTGLVEVSAIDRPDGSAQTVTAVRDAAGTRTRVHTAERLAPGAVASVTGLRIGGDMLATEVSTGSLPAGGAFGEDAYGRAEVVSDATGPQPTAILLVAFSDTGRPSVTRAQMDEVLSQVDSYYREASYGRASFPGRSFGWYDLPLARTCDVDAIQAAAIQAADNEVDFLSYPRLVIVGSFGCSWRGYSSLGKTTLSSSDGSFRASVTFIDAERGGPPDVFVMAHELGHSLGLGHSGYARCGTAPFSEECPRSAYGDPFSVMGGSGAPGHIPAPMKDYLGWFDQSSLGTVTVGGRYVLSPFETSSGLRALRLQRKAHDYLYVEYRQPIGWDARLRVWPDTDVFSGATLHALVPTSPYPRGSIDNASLLVDPSPPATDATRSALTVGSSFTDPASGARLTVVGRTDAGLTVDVAMGKTDFGSPSVRVTSPGSGARVSGVVEVTAEASAASGIQKVVFSYHRPGGPMTVFGTDTSAPFSAALDTTALGEGGYIVTASAVDRSGEPFGAAGNVASSDHFVTVTRAPTTTVPTTAAPTTSSTSTTQPSSYDYACAGAVGVTPNSAVLQAVTSDPSVTSASFTLYTNNGLTQVGPVQTDTSRPFSVGVEFLEPSKAYTYWVSFGPGGRAQSNSPCGFTTMAPTATTSTTTSTTTQPPEYSYACTFATNVSTTSAVVNASTNDPAISSAVFAVRRDGSLIGTKTAVGPPFFTAFDALAPSTQYTFTVVFNPGEHAQTTPPCAFTTQSTGPTTTAPTTTTTIADTEPPTVAMLVPASGAVLASPVGVRATAGDNVGVVQVEFWKDDDTFAFAVDTTSPYEVAVPFGPGAHKVWATAADAAGNVGRAEPVSFVVDNAPPAVSITSPAEGEEVDPSAVVVITAEASDDTAVVAVEFMVDGAAISSDFDAPFEAAWSVAHLAPGSEHELRARAVDRAGRSALSPAVRVRIADTESPAVVIAAPAPGSTVAQGRSVRVRAEATDNVGVARVEIVVDGRVLCTATAVPYSCDWTVPVSWLGLLFPTTHSVQALAYDDAGNYARAQTEVQSRWVLFGPY